MTAQLLAGQPVADAVFDDLRERIEQLGQKDIVPGLGTILVGEDSASAGYVRKKHETCEALGFRSFHEHVPADGTQDDLLAAVQRFNDDPSVHGYLIQHPVPSGYDFNAALLAMDPNKDADGLHPVNLGRLVLQEKGPVPCTPAGIQAMLGHYGIETRGKHLVVIGRGPTLGRPLSLLMTTKHPHANCAVTVVHTGVDDLVTHVKRADIVVAAVGVPGFVQPEMIKPGAVVVSGGISWKGKKLLADVDESVGEVASWITPRLGGVGPTTVAMLLRNTVELAEAAHG